MSFALRSCATAFLAFLLSLVFALTAAAQQKPVLQYSPPPNTFRQAVAAPEDYSFKWIQRVGVVLSVPPFQWEHPAVVPDKLLRDWISPLHQEQNVGAPHFQTLNVPGAQLVRCRSWVFPTDETKRHEDRRPLGGSDRALK